MTKYLTPGKIANKIKQLKKEMTELENRIIQQSSQRTMINISKEVTFNKEYNKGKITGFSIMHKCWFVATMKWNEYPDFRMNNEHYQVDWVYGNIRILWNGRY